jgi:hypothetical protein
MRDVIDMAREAGAKTPRSIWPPTFAMSIDFTLEALKAFEALVRADEREACAKDFEAEAYTWTAWPQAGAAKRKGAAAIRARGQA